MSVALRSRAEGVRDETKKRANTAERVGSVLVDIVTELDELSKTVTGEKGLEKKVDELAEKVEALSRKLDEFMGFTYIESIDFPAEGGTVKIGVKTTCKEWEVT